MPVVSVDDVLPPRHKIIDPELRGILAVQGERRL